MCNAVSLGPCADCSGSLWPDSLDLRISRSEARPDLLVIHDRFIAAGRAFGRTSLRSLSYNAQVPRPRRTRRKKVVTTVVPGWALCGEVGREATFERQIVLLPSGEILGDDGTPLLTHEHLLDDHWAVAQWFSIALDRYGLNGWPSGAEDPRQLAVEFHTTAAMTPQLEPAKSAPHVAPRRERWRRTSKRSN